MAYEKSDHSTAGMTRTAEENSLSTLSGQFVNTLFKNHNSALR